MCHPIFNTFQQIQQEKHAYLILQISKFMKIKFMKIAKAQFVSSVVRVNSATRYSRVARERDLLLTEATRRNAV